ncbi:MAG: EF-hand domain-containing protein, partial [Pirellulales bacterium]|nr:EF-hand domain-containing protein [Pirellulales bacterium]
PPKHMKQGKPWSGPPKGMHARGPWGGPAKQAKFRKPHGGPAKAAHRGPRPNVNRAERVKHMIEASKKRFEKADKNKDGKISLNEVPEKGREGFKKLLAKADKDGDKALSKKEAQAMMVSMVRRIQQAQHKGPGGPKNVEASKKRFHEAMAERFKKADKNKDGKLSRDEAPERLKAHFSELDANADGQLTPQELTTAMKKRMEAAKKHGPKKPDRACKDAGKKKDVAKKPHAKKAAARKPGPPKPPAPEKK